MLAEVRGSGNNAKVQRSDRPEPYSCVYTRIHLCLQTCKPYVYRDLPRPAQLFFRYLAEIHIKSWLRAYLPALLPPALCCLYGRYLGQA